MPFDPMMESYAGWAQRELDEEANRVMLGSLAASVPQTAPVPPPLPPPSIPMVLRRLADAYELAEAGSFAAADALAMLEELPQPLQAVLAQLLGQSGEHVEPDGDEGEDDEDEADEDTEENEAAVAQEEEDEDADGG